MAKIKLKVSPTLPDSRPLPGANAGPSRPLTRNTQTPGLPGATQKIRQTRSFIPR
jgi:hypothetical protein